MGIEDIYRGCKDKANAVREFASKRNLLLSEIAFMGDDLDQYRCHETKYLSAAPANAHASVLVIANFISAMRVGMVQSENLWTLLSNETFRKRINRKLEYSSKN